jgi:hypothetical protein
MTLNLDVGLGLSIGCVQLATLDLDQITSKNAKISTLDLYSFFWLGIFSPNFGKLLIYI